MQLWALIFWRGWGFLAGAIPFAALVLMQLAVDAVEGEGTYTRNAFLYGGAALLPSGYLVWTLGRRWHGARKPSTLPTAEDSLPDAMKAGDLPGRAERPPATERRRHTLYFVPMEYWGMGVGLIGLGMLIRAALVGPG